MRPARLFYSYSPQDEAMREHFETHLASLQRQKIIESWHERRVIAGAEKQAEIDRHFHEADIVLLLVSPSYVADARYETELEHSLARHEAGTARVIPVLLRPTDMKGLAIEKLQRLPKDGRPISTWANQDEAWLGVVGAIREAADDLQAQSREPGPRHARLQSELKPASDTAAVFSGYRYLNLPTVALLAGLMGAAAGALVEHNLSRDEWKEVERMLMACTQGNEPSCGKEFEHYQHRCDVGDLDACNYLGALHQNGKGTIQDELQALALYRRACDGGNIVGCFNLGQLYEKGTAGPRDETLAVKLYDRGCAAKYMPACNGLGRMYEHGGAVPQNEAKAADLYEQACQGGYAYGCSNLGLILESGIGKPRDVTQAYRLYQQACDSRAPLGCINLGYMYENGVSGVIDKDPGRAVKLYKAACDLKNAKGCTYLALMYRHGWGVPLDRSYAAQLNEQACEQGDARGCNNLGDIYEHGDGVAPDAVRAFVLYRKACDRNYSVGCSSLANMYEKGTAVTKDVATAIEHRKRACALGHKPSCKLLIVTTDSSQR